MSETKWTKGDFLVADDGRTVYALSECGRVNRVYFQVSAGYVHLGRERTSEDEVKAVATVCASAPKLYEALAACADALNRTVDFALQPPSRLEVLALIESARTALASARGEG